MVRCGASAKRCRPGVSLAGFKQRQALFKSRRQCLGRTLKLAPGASGISESINAKLYCPFFCTTRNSEHLFELGSYPRSQFGISQFTVLQTIGHMCTLNLHRTS